MKAVMFFVLTIVIPLLCAAEYDKDAFARLLRNGAVAKYVYRVVDDEGALVSNATAHVWFKSYGRPQDEASWAVKTDTNGIFVAEHRLNEKFSVGIDKEGYYHTHDEINYFGMSAAKRLSIVKDGKWQPYGETRTVVLKKIKNPTVMSPTKGENRRGYPEDGVWAGYDLEKHDWVAPIGNGVCEDMKIRFVTQRFSDVDFARTMDVSFADIPHGGAYKMAADEFSEFKTVYSANTNAAYLSTFKYEFKHEGRKLVRDELAKDEYLVFRTRTTVNPDGSLKSAHYGVIMGNWKFFEPYGMGIGRTLFNPTPNDTNLEDAETARKSRLGYKQQLEFERRRKAGK